MRRGGDYLFLPGFFSLYDAIHGWMTRRMDVWKKLHEKRPQCPLLYGMGISVIVIMTISKSLWIVEVSSWGLLGLLIFPR